MEPLSFVATAFVEGERFSLEGRDDEMGEHFLRELVGAVIVRTIADRDGEAKGMVVGADSHIGACLGSVVRSSGTIGTLFRKGFVGIQREVTIDFACGDVMKAGDTAFVCGIQENLGSENIRAKKKTRVDDGAGVMGLRSEVDDDVRFFFFECCRDCWCIGDIPLDKAVSFCLFTLDIPQIFPVAGIRQEIVVHDPVFRMSTKPVSDEVAPDKSRAARYE